MCFRCSCQIMNFTRMLGSLVIKKHVVCRRSRPSSSLVGGRVWSRPGLGARRGRLGALARRHDWPLVRTQTSPSLPPEPPARCFQRSNPGAGQSSEDASGGGGRWRCLVGPWRSVTASSFPAASGGSAPWPGASATCPAQRRWHLLRHRTTDAFPGPEVFPVPFVPGGPRPGLGQGEVCAGRPAGWPTLRRPAPGSELSRHQLDPSPPTPCSGPG